MVIFIKTFNRPYYLDRCLASIEKCANGGLNEIIIMDDGTDDKYLHKIKTKYPYVKIVSSEYSKEKVMKINNYINEGIPIDGLKLPSEFWKNTIDKYSQDYFLLLEDDIWLCNNIDLNNTKQVLGKNNIVSLKLNYFGNERLICGSKKKVDDLITILYPKLITENLTIFKNVILKNPFKLLSILSKLHLYNPNEKINYYSLYTVAGAIFNKEYYNHLWEGFNDISTEDGQLVRALEYYKYNNSNFAYTEIPILQTSFTSSATNSFKDIKLDVFYYNYIINEAWYNNKLDPTQNFKNDIDSAMIEFIIKDKIDISEWKKWKKRFSDQYISIGHKI